MSELLNEPDPDGAVDLANMTKAQLLEYAEDNGVEGVSSSMKKAEIYEAIINAE